MFDVNSDLCVKRDRKQSNLIRVRKIEAQRVSAAECGFAIRAILESQRLGIRSEISRNNGTQETASDDEVSSMLVEMKPPGALELTGFQRATKPVQRVVILIERDAPHVDRTRVQRQRRRRLGPG